MSSATGVSLRNISCARTLPCNCVLLISMSYAAFFRLDPHPLLTDLVCCASFICLSSIPDYFAGRWMIVVVAVLLPSVSSPVRTVSSSPLLASPSSTQQSLSSGRICQQVECCVQCTVYCGCDGLCSMLWRAVEQ